MKRNQKQQELQNEIVECYKKEMELMTDMLQAVSNADRSIVEMENALNAMHQRREELFSSYSSYLKEYRLCKDIHESIIHDFNDIDREYRNNIHQFKEGVSRVRNKLVDVSGKLQYSNSFISICRRKKRSFANRIHHWTRHIRRTYEEIYSA